MFTFLLKFLLSYTDVMEDLYNWINPKTKKHSPMISEKTYKIITKNADVSSLVFAGCVKGRGWFLLRTLRKSCFLPISNQEKKN